AVALFLRGLGDLGRADTSGATGERDRRCHRRRDIQAFRHSNLPLKSGPAVAVSPPHIFGFMLPPAIFSQVPTGTSTKDCGSESPVDRPLQLWAPALQSFLPALATPKHCSVSCACANFTAVIDRAMASAEATKMLFLMIRSLLGVG